MRTYRTAFNPRQPKTPMQLATEAGRILCMLNVHMARDREIDLED